MAAAGNEVKTWQAYVDKGSIFSSDKIITQSIRAGDKVDIKLKKWFEIPIINRSLFQNDDDYNNFIQEDLDLILPWYHDRDKKGGFYIEKSRRGTPETINKIRRVWGITTSIDLEGTGIKIPTENETKIDVNNFNTLLRSFIDINLNNLVLKDPGFRLSSDFPVWSGMSGGPRASRKDKVWGVGFIKAIDVLCNTLILYLEKALEENPEALSHCSIIGFYNLIHAIYYIIAHHYYGDAGERYLCNIFEPFTNKINSIFSALPGGSNIIACISKGVIHEACRGMYVGRCKGGKLIIILGDNYENTDEVDQTPMFNDSKLPTCGGRRKTNRKKHNKRSRTRKQLY